MLYNKAWGTKTEPLTLAHFIQWLESKDPNEAYRAANAQYCALAQWVKSIDPAAHQESIEPWIIIKYEYTFCYNVNGKVIDLAYYNLIVMERPHRFGAALKRAKAIQNGTSSV
jgi:hypothetical protein